MTNSDYQLRTAKSLGERSWERGKNRNPETDNILVDMTAPREGEENASIEQIHAAWLEGWDERDSKCADKMRKDISYQVGDKVSVKWNHKHYDGKSVRREVMDDIIEYCMGLPVTNIAKSVVGMRYLLDYEMGRASEDNKLFVDFQSGKRHALPKISDEKRGWIRKISETIDQFDHAVVIGVEVSPHHLSMICPSHLSYHRERMSELVKYKLMVVGKNEVAFEISVLTNDIEPLK